MFGEETHRPARLDRYSAAATAPRSRLVWLGSILTLLLAAGLVHHLSRDGSRSPEVGNADAGSESAGRVLSARGGVEYRRGDHGAWVAARSGDRLSRGDWIKTSADGIARIRFPDGSTYELPPGTVGRLDQLAAGSAGEDVAPEIEFHWVDLGTDVASSAPSRRPGPRLVSPASDHEIDLATQKQIQLAWNSVPVARRYALNVSSSPSFASNIIEDNDRRKPSARVGIRGEGIFYWRVAAYGRDGSQGSWSEVRSFRVAATVRATDRS